MGYWADGDEGSAAKLNGIIPTGSILPFAGVTAPTDFLLCNGATVSKTTYAALFAITGHAYGADPGSGNFILPDLRGRIPVGKSTDTEFDVLGETGGEKTHVLTGAEMPSHTHSWQGGGGAGATPVGTPAQQSGGQPNTGSAGGDAAHNNLQPYLTINYIIKY